MEIEIGNILSGNTPTIYIPYVDVIKKQFVCKACNKGGKRNPLTVPCIANASSSIAICFDCLAKYNLSSRAQSVTRECTKAMKQAVSSAQAAAGAAAWAAAINARNVSIAARNTRYKAYVSDNRGLILTALRAGTYVSLVREERCSVCETRNLNAAIKLEEKYVCFPCILELGYIEYHAPLRFPALSLPRKSPLELKSFLEQKGIIIANLSTVQYSTAQKSACSQCFYYSNYFLINNEDEQRTYKLCFQCVVELFRKYKDFSISTRL